MIFVQLISLFYRYDLSTEYMGDVGMKKAITTVNQQQQSGAFEKKVSSHFHYWIQPKNLDIS